MSRLLRPGIHSGAIPNLYANLSRAERRAHRIEMHAGSGKYREALHHVEERVRHFVEREFLALLHGSKDWNHAPVEAGKMNISSNRIALDLPAASSADESAWIAFE